MATEYGPKNRYNAYGIPSLDITFADKKNLIDRISGNNLITFTRSSTGTYVGSDGLIKTAAVNEARFDHNPLTRESLGLLIEESRVNLNTASATPSINWSASNGSWVTVTGIIAPDGSTSVELFTENTSNTTHGSGRFYDNTYTGHALSFFVKSNGRNRFYINLDTTAGISNQALVNLSSGTVTPVSTDLRSYKLVPYPNNWYRLEIVSGSGNRGYINIDLANDTNNTTYTGDGSGIYFWGMQYEKGVSFCTSYIPTSGSTVTRGADVASMNANRYLYGTFFAKYKHQPGNANNREIFSIGNPNAYNAFVCRTTPSNTANIVLPSILDLTSTVNTESSQFNSVATTRVLGDYALSLNGGNVATSNSSADNTNNAVITFMYGSVGAISGGHIARFTYYPTRLPDTTLQGLTKS